MNRKEFLIILWVCVSLITIGFASYIIIALLGVYYGTSRVYLEQISHFASYHGYFLAFVNVILIGFISYRVYQSTDTFNRFQMSPILDFTVKNRENWFLINCSNAAARNISIRFGGKFSKTEQNDEFDISGWIACLSLKGGDEMELKWLKYVVWIEIVYANPTNNIFYKIRYEDLRMSNYCRISSEEMEDIISDRYNFFDVDMRFEKHFDQKKITEESYRIFWYKFLRQ
ncbi:hypothetical protein [Salmonirosea aquatica]|uniref:Uncharacterized protein n=1 Tax=Salmonirosea aquatica TaxID=2654236 RepID=A0A7C9FRB9_9BACT|nr:hypothetical protein [Cytophagaceae bacterium SJW1-29]